MANLGRFSNLKPAVFFWLARIADQILKPTIRLDNKRLFREELMRQGLLAAQAVH